MEPLAVGIERQGKQLSVSYDFSKPDGLANRASCTTPEKPQPSAAQLAAADTTPKPVQPTTSTPDDQDDLVLVTKDSLPDLDPSQSLGDDEDWQNGDPQDQVSGALDIQQQVHPNALQPGDSSDPSVEQQPGASTAPGVQQHPGDARDQSIERQLSLWDQGLPLETTSEQLEERLDRSSASSPPPASNPSTSTSQEPGYSREPRPLNRRQADGKVVITVEPHMDSRLAVAAIRNTLTSRGRPSLEIFAAGNGQLMETLRMLVVVDTQLRRRGRRVVMQPLWQEGGGAKNEGRMRFFVGAVGGLEVEAAGDLKVHRASGVDAVGQLLDARLQEARDRGEGPPLVGVDVLRDEESVGAAVRALVEARLRGKSRKKPEDISVALEVLPAEGDSAQAVLRLVCMRCPKDSPQLLNWYVRQDTKGVQ